MRFATLYVSTGLLLLAATFANGQDLRRGNDPNLAPVNAVPEENTPLAAKKAWLLRQLQAEFPDAQSRRKIAKNVANMDANRVDQLLAINRRRQAEFESNVELLARQQVAVQQAYRNQLMREYQARLAAARAAQYGGYGYGGRPVGYAPVITWLPQGTSLSAGAVVSPDRRYVRINAQPFFSSIPRVDTFNFRTGEVRTIYENRQRVRNRNR